MSILDTSEVGYLREVFKLDRADRRMRIGATVSMAVIFGPMLGPLVVLTWLAATLFVALVIETWARRMARDDWPLARWRTLVGAYFVVHYGVTGSIALIAGLKAGISGLVVGELLLCSLLLYANTTARRSRLAYFAAMTPLGVEMMALALIGLRLEQQVVGVVTMMFGAGAMLFISADSHRRAMVQEIAGDLARHRAEKATAAKSAFVAMVSHELRTPISGILAGAVELQKSAGDAAGRANAALILDSGRMMRSLLNDLLDIAKLEAGRMNVEEVAFDLRRHLIDTVRFWRPEVRKRGLRLTIAGVHAVPSRALGDPLRLRQVLNNLMSNALKFTETGGIRLQFTVQPGKGEAFSFGVAVMDTGPGMDAGQLGRLFQPFEQLTPVVARTHGGTGLGLSISRELTRLMGGELTAESTPGQGAVFRMIIPLVRLPREAGDGAVLETASADALTVLVADDHAVNRQAFRLILEAAGAQVTTVDDGQAALTVLGQESFDVVLMDLNMPQLGGMEATRRLRAEPGPNAGAIVIALTASTSPSEVDACLAAGMDAFVMKPIEAAELLAAMDEALGRRRSAPRVAAA